MYINLIQIFRQMVVHNYYEINDKKVVNLHFLTRIKLFNWFNYLDCSSFKAEQFRLVQLVKYVYKDEYNPANGRMTNPNQTRFNFNLKRFSMALANGSLGTFAGQQAHQADSGSQTGVRVSWPLIPLANLTCSSSTSKTSKNRRA